MALLNVEKWTPFYISTSFCNQTCKSHLLFLQDDIHTFSGSKTILPPSPFQGVVIDSCPGCTLRKDLRSEGYPSYRYVFFIVTFWFLFYNFVNFSIDDLYIYFNSLGGRWC